MVASTPEDARESVAAAKDFLAISGDRYGFKRIV
jgi:hypothetical protein